MNTRRRLSAVYFAGYLMICGSAIYGADRTWLVGSGDWNTPGNWSGGVIPGPNDNAIINSGTVTLDTDASVDSLTFSSGTLQGAGLVHITGTLEWSGGTMGGSGKTVIEAGAVGNWSGGGDKWLARPMDNLGTINWGQGRLVEQDAVFSNVGQMTISHDGDIVSAGGATVFENTGTLHKLSAGTVTISGVAFNNTGQINIPMYTFGPPFDGSATVAAVVTVRPRK
jgi:hypothetical protein